MVLKDYEEGIPRGIGHPLMTIRSRLMRAKWKDGPSIRPLMDRPPTCHCQPVLRFTKQDDQEHAIQAHPGEELRLQLADASQACPT